MVGLGGAAASRNDPGRIVASASWESPGVCARATDWDAPRRGRDPASQPASRLDRQRPHSATCAHHARPTIGGTLGRPARLPGCRAAGGSGASREQGCSAVASHCDLTPHPRCAPRLRRRATPIRPPRTRAPRTFGDRGRLGCPARYVAPCARCTRWRAFRDRSGHPRAARPQRARTRRRRDPPTCGLRPTLYRENVRFPGRSCISRCIKCCSDGCPSVAAFVIRCPPRSENRPIPAKWARFSRPGHGMTPSDRG